MRHLAAPLLLVLALLLTSCDEDARGLVISSDGGVQANTPTRHRARVIAHITEELNQQLGEHWLSTVAIAELPVYDDDFNRAFPDNWYWSKATVQVALIGDGQKPLPAPAKEYSDAVWDYLHRRVDRPKRNLSIDVSTLTDPARYAELHRGSGPAAAPAAATAPAAPAPAAPRSYTVQTGDTLAIISSVFYGTPDHWRLIVQANPGLDAAHLVPGTRISIPPAP